MSAGPCAAFRDLGGRTFRCVLPQGHYPVYHKGVAGTQSNCWADGARGAMGSWYPLAGVDSLRVAAGVTDHDTGPQPHQADLTGPTTTPPGGVGPVRVPYPANNLAVPNGLNPTENQDAHGTAGIPVVQLPYVTPQRHKDGPGYGEGEMPGVYAKLPRDSSGHVIPGTSSGGGYDDVYVEVYA